MACDFFISLLLESLQYQFIAVYCISTNFLRIFWSWLLSTSGLCFTFNCLRKLNFSWSESPEGFPSFFSPYISKTKHACILSPPPPPCLWETVTDVGVKSPLRYRTRVHASAWPKLTWPTVWLPLSMLPYSDNIECITRKTVTQNLVWLVWIVFIWFCQGAQ